MSQPVLSLSHVVKRFGRLAAVDDVSFDVQPGEIFGFLGPNGAGKTTTLRIALDIVAPTSGMVRILGARSAIPVRARIGYLPEERGLYRKMKAAETIAYFARLRGVPGREAKKRALALLEEFGLGKFARVKNEALSKGMAQKVQLLATIAHDPELLILDEPFSGLDPINPRSLEDLLLRLKAEGRTIIFSTHVMEHAERVCDRFMIMAGGQARFIGDLDAARAAMPPRVLLRTAAAPDDIARLPGVVSVEPRGDKVGETGEREYIASLEPGFDPQAVLAAALAAGLTLTKFEQGGASLHDIFVAIAGDAATPDASIDQRSRAA
ncbi:MAG: ATP-binding cassette domain-containing protein [Pseudomonadota bacterium]